MTLPERGTAQFAEFERRAHRKIVDLVSNIAIRRGALPQQVHAMIGDEITQERCGAFVRVKYFEGGSAQVTRSSIGILRDDTAAGDIADMLLEGYPETPLVCDKSIADELSRDSLTWVGNDHYRLEGRPAGVLEVFTPYVADMVSTDTLPPEVKSIQLFNE